MVKFTRFSILTLVVSAACAAVAVGAATANAERPQITKPTEGQVADTSKPRQMFVTAPPGLNIGLQFCQLARGRESRVPGNRCGMSEMIMGATLLGPISMEEIPGKPGNYQLAIDSRCGLFGLSSTKPLYIRPVAGPVSSYSGMNWYSNPDFFQRYDTPVAETYTERLDVWGEQVEVTVPDPPAGFVKPVPGISVNGGATYTNSTNVSLTVEPPACVVPYATSVELSNDGGFKRSTKRPLETPESDSSFTVNWTMISTGKERLPKTVYANISGTRYTDDIILDQRDPVIESASATSLGATGALAAGQRFRVTVKAKDSNSGVGFAQTAVNKANPSVLVRYKSRFTATSQGRPKWIRVQDRAGNFSTWKKLR
jgi:hypothetical protein